MREEGRHILFFVNWVAWWRAQHAVVAPALVRTEGPGGLGFLIWERIGIAGQMESSEKAQDNNFTLNGSKELGVEVSFGRAGADCIAETIGRLAPV